MSKDNQGKNRDMTTVGVTTEFRDLVNHLCRAVGLELGRTIRQEEILEMAVYEKFAEEIQKYQARLTASPSIGSDDES